MDEGNLAAQHIAERMVIVVLWEDLVAPVAGIFEG